MRAAAAMLATACVAAAAVADVGEGGGAGAALPRCGSFGHAISCFSGRHVVIVGSSVSRHWWFALQEVLSLDDGRAQPTDLFASTLASHNWKAQYREREKTICGGGAPAWSALSRVKGHMKKEYSTCQVSTNGNRTMLSFLWGLPFIDPQICAAVTAAVVQDSERLAGISSADSGQRRTALYAASEVILNGGLELSINIDDPQRYPERVNSTLGDILSIFAPVLDAGGAVTWRTTTRLCCQSSTAWSDPETCVNKGKTPLRPVEDVIEGVNLAVTRGIAAIEPRVEVLDAWAMTDHSKCDRYEDWVHHPKLAYDQIAVWLLKRCPACSS
jgi:hypothetical protein